MQNDFNNNGGFLTRWLICGPKLDTPKISVQGETQEEFENNMRKALPNDVFSVPSDIILGESFLGGNWKYWYSGNNIFVDISDFYHLLCSVEFICAAQIVSGMERKLEICLWCYPATDLWVNGERVIRHEHAVYKPMRRTQVSLKLKAGVNDIFVRCQNLGVRDTRNIFAVQIIGELSGLQAVLPDKDGCAAQLINAENWLNSLYLVDTHLLSGQSAPPALCILEAYTQTQNRPLGSTQEKAVTWDKGSSYDIGEGYIKIKVILQLHKQTLTKTFEIMENIKPLYLEKILPIEEHRRGVISAVGEMKKKLDPDKPMDTGVYYILARMASNGGIISADDKEILLHDLDFVNARSDCSDFYLSALLRLFMTYFVKDNELTERMREVTLNFRYWMDEEGSDGMCFWSENHTLLFNGCQLVAGLLYPNETFKCSGRTGIEMNILGNKRCSEWLDVVEKKGFEEFLSAGYMCVTAAAIIMLVDYANEQNKKRAEVLLVKLLEQISHHAFRGSTVGPIGRVYRDVITPHQQGIQSILHYADPKVPVGLSMWLSPFATSSFKFPNHLTNLMEKPISTIYTAGSAEIILVKTDNYLLSSIRCPCLEENPKYNMTTFEPGLYGYQQHLWYAALNNDCIAFINHPGVSYDESSMRPGYWNGNGILPVLKQEGKMIGGIYHLDQQRHPVNFIHLFWPSFSLEEEKMESNWFFGRKKNGYIAFWSNVNGVPFNDVLTGCEYRFVNDYTAFICIMGSEQEDRSFKAFMENAKKLNPEFSVDGHLLSAGGRYSLKYIPSQHREPFVKKF